VSAPSWGSREAAEVWRRGAAGRREAWRPSWEAAVERLGIRPGMRVLDLGAGTGDQTMLLAPLVGLSGSVLATDISAAMLDVLAEEAAAAGMANVETVAGDAAALDLPPASFDAAVSFNCLQFLPSPEPVLRRVQAALKPGAGLAALVFATADRSYMGAAIDAIRRVGGLPPPGPDDRGMFSLGAPGRLGTALHDGGFREVDVQEMPFGRTIPTHADFMRTLETPNFRHFLDQVDTSKRAAVVDAVAELGRGLVQPDGSIRGTSVSLLAIATA
jgi:SAM-dependent methyltransferase